MREHRKRLYPPTVALGEQDTVSVLAIVLARIYVLRNQIVHGGATCGSANREQLQDCTNFMAKLVPLVIEAMMDHPETLWGPGTYPLVRRPAATPRPMSPAPLPYHGQVRLRMRRDESLEVQHVLRALGDRFHDHQVLDPRQAYRHAADHHSWHARIIEGCRYRGECAEQRIGNRASHRSAFGCGPIARRVPPGAHRDPGRPERSPGIPTVHRVVGT